MRLHCSKGTHTQTQSKYNIKLCDYQLNAHKSFSNNLINCSLNSTEHTHEGVGPASHLYCTMLHYAVISQMTNYHYLGKHKHEGWPKT